VIAEINSCTSFCDGNNVLEYCFEWLRRHEVGDEGGHAALHRGRRLTIGIGRLTRPRDILSVAEMEMNVDGAGHDDEATRRDLLLSRGQFVRRQYRCYFSSADRDIAGGASVTGKNGVSAFDHKVKRLHCMDE